jgi:inosine-uridine nucleoside N-ribohydrolase
MVRRQAELWDSSGYHGAFDRPGPGPASGLDAIRLLIETIDRHSGSLTVLALGPMTNLATVFRLRPDLEKKIRRLVFMGGNVAVPGNVTRAAEFNFWFDPEAAAAVLRSAVPEKVMFALDITNQAPLTRALFDRIAAVQTPVTALYRDDFGYRYPGFLRDAKATGHLWDELPAVWLADPATVTAEQSRYLDVVTEFGPRYGAVVELDRRLAPQATPVRVMQTLDPKRLTALYVGTLTAR